MVFEMRQRHMTKQQKEFLNSLTKKQLIEYIETHYPHSYLQSGHVIMTNPTKNGIDVTGNKQNYHPSIPPSLSV